MNSNIYTSIYHTFAFEVIVQIIRLKLDTGENLDSELKDLMRIINFDKALEPQNPDELRLNIPKLVQAILNEKYPEITIFDRFEKSELERKLNYVLETYYQFYLRLPDNPKDGQELQFLQDLRSKIFTESKVHADGHLTELIKTYQAKLKEDKVEKLGNLFIRVKVAFKDDDNIISEVDFSIITGLIAIQLGFADSEKLETAIKDQDVYEFLRALMKGAIERVYRNNLINPDTKMPRPKKKSE
jgi:hypothetical protein